MHQIATSLEEDRTRIVFCRHAMTIHGIPIHNMSIQTMTNPTGFHISGRTTNSCLPECDDENECGACPVTISQCGITLATAIDEFRTKVSCLQQCPICDLYYSGETTRCATCLVQHLLAGTEQLDGHCPICQEVITADTARSSKCGHVYHIKCFNECARKTAKCAVCRASWW